jgi:hypothetical protein
MRFFYINIVKYQLKINYIFANIIKGYKMRMLIHLKIITHDEFILLNIIL